MKINDLVKEAYDNAVEKGWHESPRSALEVHMLIVSEIAEATEAVRDGLPPIYQVHKTYSKENGEHVETSFFIPYNHFTTFKSDDGLDANRKFNWKAERKPEGELIELADAVIRIADYLADDSWVIMQSTGLKDKNGKLIFESEIVMTPAGAGFIEWMKGMWIIAWPKGGGTHLHNTKSSDMGIIGNIYENPELLEGSK